jgi:hypothetical protein
MQALNKENLPCSVHSIHVIPDYEAYLADCIDPDFGRYAKTQWTQLVWKFEAVDVCPAFPLGVKTTYRSYSTDEVRIIITFML